MLNQFSITQLLYGETSMQKPASCRVAVFGIGGVGGYGSRRFCSGEGSGRSEKIL